MFINLRLISCCIHVSKIAFQVRCYGSVRDIRVNFTKESNADAFQCHANDRFCPYVPEDPRVRKLRSAIFWPRHRQKYRNSFSCCNYKSLFGDENDHPSCPVFCHFESRQIRGQRNGSYFQRGKNQREKHLLNFTRRNGKLNTYTATVCFRPKNKSNISCFVIHFGTGHAKDKEHLFTDSCPSPDSAHNDSGKIIIAI